MEIFRPIQQISQTGYPIIVFYIIVLVGLVLIIYRPYWAFYCSIFSLAARNYHAAVFTRSPVLGAYLNLNDLLLWIALFSLLFIILRTKRMLWFPNILLAIFSLVAIGSFQSLFQYGLTEDVMRSIWQALIFPILFLVSANMVRDQERAHHFYWALFLGASIAALQHVLFIRSASSYDLSTGLSQLRTISYIMSGGLFLIISAIIDKPYKSIKRFKTILFYFGLGLMAISYVLSLTRGLYVYVVLTLLFLPILLRKTLRPHKTVLYGSLIASFALLIIKFAAPELELAQIINDRFESFMTRDTFSESYETRWLGAQTEFNLWLDSSLIFGVGSSLPPEIIAQSKYDVFQTGALYHVGLTTYLAHFGLFGIFIYGIILPVMTVIIAKRYFVNHSQEWSGKVALIAIVCSVLDIIGLGWSHHHLSAITHINALIYGAIWGLHRAAILEKKANLLPQRLALRDNRRYIS